MQLVKCVAPYYLQWESLTHVATFLRVLTVWGRMRQAERVEDFCELCPEPFAPKPVQFKEK